MIARWRRWAVRGAVVAVGVLAGLAARDVALVARDLGAARDALADVTLTELAGPADLRAVAGSAADRLATAHRRAERSPWLMALRPVPIAGDHVRAVRDLTATSARFVDAINRRAARAEAALERVEGSGAIGGRRVLATLAVVRREAEGLQRDIAAISVPDPPRVVTPLRDAVAGLRSRMAEATATMAAGTRALAALERLFQGPSTYVVLAANNGEMRGGTGMPLSVGTIRFDDGSFRASPFVPAADLLLDHAEPVPDGVERLYGWLEPGREWRNTLSSPNFPAMAPVYASMARAAGLADADGVLLLDVVALRHLLGVVGPVSVDGLRLDAASVEQALLSNLYARFGSDVAGRRQLLGRVAEEVVAAFDARAWSADDLARAVARAAGGRHLMAWAADAEEQEAWRTIHADGGLVPTGLMLAVQNHGANKLDVHLDVAAEIHQQLVADRRVVDVRMRLANHAPARLPGYVAGPGTLGLPAGDYRAFLTFYLPQAAFEAQPRGAKVVAAGEDGPMRVIAVRRDIARGGSADIGVRFSLPRDHPSLTLLPSGRAAPATVVWRHEVLTDDRARTVAW